MLATSSPTIIIGDINVHLEKPDDVDSRKLSAIINSVGVKQFMKSPTHELGGLLDVIIVPQDRPPKEVVIMDIDLSDHMLVTLIVNMLSPASVSVNTARRSWKSFYIKDFISQLQMSEL